MPSAELAGIQEERRIVKVIARIRGGLGNQLFCYAAARRLALVNDAELVIDHVTGFVRDYKYRSQYMLDPFNISARKATPAERLEPFERYRRGVLKWSSRRRAFAERRYLEQEGRDFDERLLGLQVNGTLRLDGLWQSEMYFEDVEETIREDLRLISPMDPANISVAQEIREGNSVAVHVRWFDSPAGNVVHNVSADYYQRALSLIQQHVDSPRYFVFTDDPTTTSAHLGFPTGTTLVSHNQGREGAHADFWLMRQCRYFIIANSTFSWWGAWLGEWKEKIVVCPGVELAHGTITSWNFRGQIPPRWLKV